MVGRVRCVCGRYMGLLGFQPGTYVSGAMLRYRCSRCGAVAVFNYVVGDDVIANAWLNLPSGGDVDMRWDDDRFEWRVVRPARAA